MSLTLVGSIHSDFDEVPRLRAVLEEEQPDILLIEGSEAWGRVNDRIDRQIRKRLKRLRISQEVRKWQSNYYRQWKFEQREVKEYASRNRTRLGYLEPDPVFPSLDVLEAWVEEQISSTLADIERSGQAGVDQAVQHAAFRVPHIRGIIERVLSDPQFEFRELQPMGDVAGVRDAMMANAVLQTVSQYPESHVVAVTGLGHILGNVYQASLYSLIRHLQPKRVFLPLE